MRIAICGLTLALSFLGAASESYLRAIVQGTSQDSLLVIVLQTFVGAIGSWSAPRSHPLPPPTFTFHPTAPAEAKEPAFRRCYTTYYPTEGDPDNALAPRSPPHPLHPSFLCLRFRGIGPTNLILI
eukprot:scaffold35781_cov32-Tisochrysis_lutea.AAC.2